MGAVPHADRQPLYVRIGNASRRRHHGCPGSKRRPQNPVGPARMKTAIVIGGGHNGLITAFYLAKAGVKPVVLEARNEVGGGAITTEIHPGFRCPTLTH